MDELEKYYQYLRSRGADVPNTYQSFKNTLSDDKSARQYHKYLLDNKFDAPENYDSFAKTFGLSTKTKEPTYTQPTTTQKTNLRVATQEEFDKYILPTMSQEDKDRIEMAKKQHEIQRQKEEEERQFPTVYKNTLEQSQKLIDKTLNESGAVIDKYVHGKILKDYLDKKREEQANPNLSLKEKLGAYMPSGTSALINPEYEKLYAEKKKETLGNSDEVLNLIVKDKKAKNPEEAKHLDASIYMLKNQELANQTGQHKLLLKNASEIQKGNLVQIGGQAIKPVDALEAIFEGVKHKNETFDLYNIIQSGDREKLKATLNEKMKPSLYPAKAAVGWLPKITESLGGMPLGTVVAGGIGGLAGSYIGMPQLGRVTAMAVGAQQFGDMEHAAEVERVYAEVKNQYPNLSDDEALDMALAAGDRAHVVGAVTGAAFGALPSTKLLPISKSLGMQKVVTNIMKNIGKESLLAGGVAGLAAGGQIAKNVSAQGLGIDRDTLEGVPEATSMMLFMHVGARIAAGAAKGFKNLTVKDKKSAQLQMAKLEPEQVKVIYEEQVDGGITTEAEANKAQKEINDIRVQDSKIDPKVTDESRLKIAKLQEEYDRLDSEIETQHKTSHPEKKERQKAIEEEISVLLKDKVKPTEAEKAVNKAADEGLLTDVNEMMAKSNPEEFMKMVAQQAYGITENGKVSNIENTEAQARSYFGDALVDKAMELYPKPKVSVIQPNEIKQHETITIKPKQDALPISQAEDVSVHPSSRDSETMVAGGKTEKTAEGESVVAPTKEEGVKPPEVKELDKLANNVPDSGKVAEYMSKETITKYTGEPPTNDQTRGIQELAIALDHGEKIIEKAKEIYGSDYVDKTLDYIDNSSAGVSNKALMYVSLENALGKEKLLDPSRAAELTKQQAAVYAKSQAFARENSLALNYQKLRRIAQVGYDIEKVTDSFFSADELAGKKEISKAIEADGDAINKEAEAQETIHPDVEKAIKEGVEKEVAKIYEALPKEKKSAVDRAISALENIQQKLRNKTYESTLGIPVAIIDAGITTIKLALKAGVEISHAIELGINKIKEKYGKPWANEAEFRKDVAAAFPKKTKPKKSTKDVIKDALIEKGFGREFMHNGEKKVVLDWKKLAGAAGTISKIRENVNSVLEEKGLRGLTDVAKGVIKEDFIKEYVDLRTSVIEKAQNELARRNKETVTPEQKTAAKKLSELYTFGLFEQKSGEFENALNKALGAKVSEKGFQEAKNIAKALETIYSSSFKGVKLNDVSGKAAIEKVEDQLRILLFRESKTQGNFNLKAASIVRNYFEIQQTMILNNLKQAVENPLSGLQQNLIDKMVLNVTKESTPEMATQRRGAMKSIYSDMVLNGGIGYGKIESQFVNRQHIDDYVNKLSDSQLYHGIASVVTGKATLNAMDAMFKAGITEKKFASNLIKILTHETNTNRMSKQEAVKFISEKLTGQTFKDAQVTAKEIVQKINKDAGFELVGENEAQINRFANDIVKSALEMGGKITSEQITAAYNAAYKSAGLGLGHRANNILSSTIQGYSARLEGDINMAIKDKEWNRAAMLTYKSILFRNVLNPFVGGGTNWLVLKLEKTGLGLISGLAYQIGSKSRIDLSTELGMSRLEARLYNQARVKDNYMRGLIGGMASTLTYLAYKGITGSDDSYRKWRGKNPWAARYTDILTPEVALLEMGVKNDAVKKYVGTSFNKNDAFDASSKAVKALEFVSKGKTNEAWGAAGELLGSKLNAPVPWRLVKDGQVIYQGITGQDPYHGNYKPSTGFMNGVLQGGVIEWLGFRPSGAGETRKKKVINE